MKTARQSAAVVPDPNEWDFRGLKREHFRVALHYELARENPRLKEALMILTPDRRRELDRIRKEDWENERHDWLKGDPRLLYRFFNVFHACWCCGKFPVPWMTLLDAEQKVAAERFGERQAVRVISREEYRRSEAMREMAHQTLKKLGHEVSLEASLLPIERYVVEIDWSADDPILKSELLSLLTLRPEGTRPHKRYTGKRASPHAHLFRQLAAWRLASRAKLNYKAALELMGERRKAAPKDDPFKLLRDYESPGAWNGAVAAGVELVRRGS